MSTRREFIKNMAGATTALCCGISVSSLLESCATTAQIKLPLNEGKLYVDKALFLENDFVVVNNGKLPAPIYLHKEGDFYKASLMLCTHKQCELNIAGTVLSCPCHGAEFSTKGELLAGPAETNLRNFKITIEPSQIVIDLNK